VGSLERCDDTVAATTLPTSGTSASVEVSGVAAACAGASLGVTVYDPSTWATSTGCVVINSAGNVVNGKACSLVCGRNTAASGTSWNAKVTVTTTATKPVSRRATVDFADLTLFPFRASYVGEYTGGAVVGPSRAASAPGPAAS
jgi:hypothetical protein